MTTRKTFALNPEDTASTEAPALKKKGRGWEISDKRLDPRAIVVDQRQRKLPSRLREGLGVGQ
jgi:hypothetical protein